MNKQEALKQIEEQRDMILDLHGWGVFGYIKGIINQLDEPQKIELPKVEFKKFQKVTIPQFVADWIDACKENLAIGLYTAMNPDFLKQWNKSYELISWSKKTRNQELFARAWLDGYEVEKEKRYLVKMKGLVQKNSYLNFNLGGVWLFYNEDNFDGYRAHHTRKELEEAGFGEVFNSPLFEVVEVE